MRHDKISDLFGFKARNAIAIAALAMMVALFFCAVAYAAPESQTSASSQGAQGGTDVTKSEVVYGMLNSDGSVRTTYVVNRFVSNAPCRWADYGAYTLVSNLSTAQPLICENEKVAWVHYAGLEGDKNYELAKKYCPKGTCGVIAFGIKGGRQASIDFMDSLKFITIVTHVADAKTCLLHPASHTHRQLTDEQLIEAGVAPDLIRLSVGTENIEDILADLKQAFGE